MYYDNGELWRYPKDIPYNNIIQLYKKHTSHYGHTHILHLGTLSLTLCAILKYFWLPIRLPTVLSRQVLDSDTILVTTCRAENSCEKLYTGRPLVGTFYRTQN